MSIYEQLISSPACEEITNSEVIHNPKEMTDKTLAILKGGVKALPDYDIFTIWCYDYHGSAVVVISAMKAKHKDKNGDDTKRIYIETAIPVATAIKQFKNTYPFSKMDYNKQQQVFSYYSSREAFMYGITFPL